MDGTPDYFIYNTELSGFDLTGQTVIAVQKAGQSTSNIYFYADADLNSGNMILTAPLAAVGLTAKVEVLVRRVRVRLVTSRDS